MCNYSLIYKFLIFLFICIYSGALLIEGLTPREALYKWTNTNTTQYNRAAKVNEYSLIILKIELISDD